MSSINFTCEDNPIEFEESGVFSSFKVSDILSDDEESPTHYVIRTGDKYLFYKKTGATIFNRGSAKWVLPTKDSNTELDDIIDKKKPKEVYYPQKNKHGLFIAVSFSNEDEKNLLDEKTIKKDNGYKWSSLDGNEGVVKINKGGVVIVKEMFDKLFEEEKRIKQIGAFQSYNKINKN